MIKYFYKNDKFGYSDDRDKKVRQVQCGIKYGKTYI